MFETLLTQVEYTGGAEVRAVWTEPMPGIRVCDFDCPAPESVPLEKKGRGYETVFCDAGAMRLIRRDGRYIKAGRRDILLISDTAMLQSVRITGRRFRGMLVLIDPENARGGLSQLYALMGDMKPDIKLLDGMMAAHDGCAAIQGADWSAAAFAALQKLPADERGRYCAFKALELLYLLCCHSPLLRPAAAPASYRDPYQMDTVRQVHDYMLEHMGDRLTIDVLTRKFHISSTALKEGFRQQYGQPVHRYLQTERIKKAAELLADTALSITQITVMVGYESAGQFGAAFKNRYQMTPSEYRRDMRSKKSETVDFRPNQVTPGEKT